MERNPEKRGLGRGLSALMADVQLDRDGAGFGSAARPDQRAPVESLVPNPNQPRRDFPAEALRELAASIRQKGVIQPLIVRPGKLPGTFEIVAGERRWRAAQLAELHEVPVIVRDLSDSEVIEIAIIENIQRADLNAVEEALAYRQLMDRFGHTQEMVAEALSRSRSHVANMLRLLNLPEEVQLMLRDGRLTAGHARALITLPDPASLARRVVAEGLSVRETERLSRKSEGPGKSKPGRQRAEKDADTRAIEADLSANLQMSVSIQHTIDGGGEMILRYRSLDDLDMLCQALSVARRDYVR